MGWPVFLFFRFAQRTPRETAAPILLNPDQNLMTPATPRVPAMARRADQRYVAGPINYSLAWILLTFVGVLGIHPAGKKAISYQRNLFPSTRLSP